jgi:molecular chaperone GrpE
MDSSETDTTEAAHTGDEVERLRRDLHDEKQQNLRVRADYDNLRKRAAREYQAAQAEGRRAALRTILPVLDALERALAVGSNDLAFLEGVESTYRLFLSALAEAGAEPILAVGRPFDPRLHEAVSYEPTRDFEPNTVAREVRRGWRLADELIRPAEVVVAAPAPTLAQDASAPADHPAGDAA